MEFLEERFGRIHILNGILEQIRMPKNGTDLQRNNHSPKTQQTFSMPPPRHSHKVTSTRYHTDLETEIYSPVRRQQLIPSKRLRDFAGCSTRDRETSHQTSSKFASSWAQVRAENHTDNTWFVTSLDTNQTRIELPSQSNLTPWQRYEMELHKPEKNSSKQDSRAHSGHTKFQMSAADLKMNLLEQRRLTLPQLIH